MPENTLGSNAYCAWGWRYFEGLTMGRCGRTRVLALKGLLLASGQLEERGENFRRVSIHVAKGSGPTPQWQALCNNFKYMHVSGFIPTGPPLHLMLLPYLFIFLVDQRFQTHRSTHHIAPD
jgi:hypothetical protein